MNFISSVSMKMQRTRRAFPIQVSKKETRCILAGILKAFTYRCIMRSAKVDFNFTLKIDALLLNNLMQSEAGA